MSEANKDRGSADEAGRPGAGQVADPSLRDQPGEQERPLSEDEELDEALDDTFPASDPAPAKQIDGPNN